MEITEAGEQLLRTNPEYLAQAGREGATSTATAHSGNSTWGSSSTNPEIALKYRCHACEQLLQQNDQATQHLGMWEFEDYTAEAADDDPEVLAGVQRLRRLRADDDTITEISARGASASAVLD